MNAEWALPLMRIESRRFGLESNANLKGDGGTDIALSADCVATFHNLTFKDYFVILLYLPSTVTSYTLVPAFPFLLLDAMFQLNTTIIQQLYIQKMKIIQRK